MPQSPYPNLRSALLHILDAQPGQPLEALREVVHLLRAPYRTSANASVGVMKALIQLLKADAELLARLQAVLRSAIIEKSYINLLTTAGFYRPLPFLADAVKRLKHTLLPEYFSETEARFALRYLFYKRWDWVWVKRVGPTLWCELFEVLFDPLSAAKEGAAKGPDKLSTKVIGEVANAVVILSHQITAVGLDPVISAKVPFTEDLASPFLEQNRLITQYFDGLRAAEWPRAATNPTYGLIRDRLSECGALMEEIRDRKHLLGISLNELYLLQRLRQMIDRVSRLMRLLHETDDRRFNTIIADLFVYLQTEENRHNSLRKMFSDNVQSFSVQLVEQSGRTGEHYITIDLKGWVRMFQSALRGGLVVGFLVIFKAFITALQPAPFIQALLYGLNYGLGFIGIHLVRGTLATKQPAMTASRIAASIRDNPRDAFLLSTMVARVARSQFIAFVGNVIIAFPVAYALSWLWVWAAGKHIASPDKAVKLMAEIDPFHSLTVLYASIAGVFLFISGLVAGYFDNKVVYRNIPERILQHEGFRRLLPRTWLARFAHYIGHNLGALSGNFFLGMCLGFAGFFGTIFGLPIDIRHITFASGSFGLAIAALGAKAESGMVVGALLGIASIGLMNFIVSFGLSFFVAMRARNVSLRKAGLLLRAISAHLYLFPFHFFFPPKREVLLSNPEKTKS